MTTASSTVTNNVTFHEILRPKAIAKALGISRPTAYRLLLNGKIPSVRLTDFAVGAYSKDVTAYLAKLNPVSPAEVSPLAPNAICGGNYA